MPSPSAARQQQRRTVTTICVRVTVTAGLFEGAEKGRACKLKCRPNAVSYSSLDARRGPEDNGGREKGVGACSRNRLSILLLASLMSDAIPRISTSTSARSDAAPNSILVTVACSSVWMRCCGAKVKACQGLRTPGHECTHAARVFRTGWLSLPWLIRGASPLEFSSPQRLRSFVPLE